MSGQTENFKDAGELQLRLAVLERDIKSHSFRLSELEQKAEKIGDIAVMTEKINTKMDMVKEKIDYVDNRLRNIETAPSADFAYYKKVIVSALITGLLGAVLGAVLAVVIK